MTVWKFVFEQRDGSLRLCMDAHCQKYFGKIGQRFFRIRIWSTLPHNKAETAESSRKVTMAEEVSTGPHVAVAIDLCLYPSRVRS